MNIKYVLTTFFAIFVTTIIIAQNTEDIRCKILDQETQYPVAYATIKFADSKNGVIADEEGEFRLPQEYKSSDKMIVISSIGFETLTIAVNTLAINSINTIYLRPKIEALAPVLVIAKTKSSPRISSTEGIIEEAIRRIGKNYPITPHSYIAYYRDYQLVNNKYYNLNESILETFDAGFHTSKLGHSKNVTAKYFYERNEKYYLDSLLLESIYGDAKIINNDESARLITTLNNELEILNGHNPIRNYNMISFSFVDKFMVDFIPNHNFTLQGIKYINDTPLYEISFITPDAEKSKFRAEGKIYIAKTNYAIFKIEYKMIENKRYSGTSINRNSVQYGSSSSQGTPRERLNTIYEVNVEYKPVNEKMYLNYITFNNRFIIKEPNPFKITDFEFDPNDGAFFITFNKSVDQNSLNRKSRFKLFYKDKKLIIKNIELVKTNLVKIEVVDWAAGFGTELTEVQPEDFTYKVKSIKDASGNKLNKESKLLGFQFREFFTQEIFENKTPSSNLIYVYKKESLSKSKNNTPDFDINKYWINSPLKQSKDATIN